MKIVTKQTQFQREDGSVVCCRLRRGDESHCSMLTIDPNGVSQITLIEDSRVTTLAIRGEQSYLIDRHSFPPIQTILGIKESEN